MADDDLQIPSAFTQPQQGLTPIQQMLFGIAAGLASPTPSYGKLGPQIAQGITGGLGAYSQAKDYQQQVARDLAKQQFEMARQLEDIRQGRRSLDLTESGQKQRASEESERLKQGWSQQGIESQHYGVMEGIERQRLGQEGTRLGQEGERLRMEQDLARGDPRAFVKWPEAPLVIFPDDPPTVQAHAQKFNEDALAGMHTRGEITKAIDENQRDERFARTQSAIAARQAKHEQDIRNRPPTKQQVEGQILQEQARKRGLLPPAGGLGPGIQPSGVPEMSPAGQAALTKYGQQLPWKDHDAFFETSAKLGIPLDTAKELWSLDQKIQSEPIAKN